MQIGVIGINHKSADLALREEIARICQKRFLFSDEPFSYVLLSTCNRSEIYFSSDNLAETHSYLLNILRHDFEFPFAHKIYSYFGSNCFFHLACVTAGLDSAIILESEIQGQVKVAYETASSYRSLSSELHFLFQKSLKIGKQIRSRLHFQREMPTLEGAIFKAAFHLLGDLAQRKILFVGLSEINQKIIKAFNKKGLNNLTLCNRTFGTEHGCTTLAWDKLSSWDTFDLIIFGTKCPHYLITADSATSPHKKLIIDLSVPRNVDPDLARLPSITLLNIDELIEVIDRKRKIKAEEIARQERHFISTSTLTQISIYHARSSLAVS